jgi:hypothetical protein
MLRVQGSQIYITSWVEKLTFSQDRRLSSKRGKNDDFGFFGGGDWSRIARIAFPPHTNTGISRYIQIRSKVCSTISRSRDIGSESEFGRFLVWTTDSFTRYENGAPGVFRGVETESTGKKSRKNRLSTVSRGPETNEVYDRRFGVKINPEVETDLGSEIYVEFYYRSNICFAF